jgi:5-methyltetrahydropteroyltriglutamate--homocysteine methyltransferase
VPVINRALAGATGPTALHRCFGYAAIIHDRPSGYSFLPELAATEADQISIETGQSGLELDVLDTLPKKTIILGVLDLSTDEVETPDTVATRIRRAFPHTDKLIAAPDCGMKYLSRAAAYGKLESLVEGARLAGSPS